SMLKGIFPAPYQPVTVTTAFFKSLPTVVLPIIAISAIVSPAVAVMLIVVPIILISAIVMPAIAVTVIVLPIIAFSAIVLPTVAVTVAPSPVLSEGVCGAGGDQECCGQSD
ncbi:MAG TPA: hypothetical protein VG324_16715, partial [Blastocatellia bacterium]|nr:hypothetical protein [Blastocatellia bacterium]